MDTKNCTSCGAQIPQDSTTCPNCGTSLGSSPVQNGASTESLPPNSSYSNSATPTNGAGAYSSQNTYNPSAQQTVPVQQGAFSPQPAPQATSPVQNQNGSYIPSGSPTGVSGPVYPYPPTSYGYTDVPAVDTMSVWSYIWPFLLSFIPFIGGLGTIILFFIWGFGSYGPNRKNYARAMLILYAIAILGVILLFALFGTLSYSFSFY